MKKPVFGVGINDANYKVNINGDICPYYRKWADMLKRCYSDKFQSTRPKYIGCTVCDEWLTFSNFKIWMIKQDWQGKHLDKDLLSLGNKVYSPDTCYFITSEINSLLCGIEKKGCSFDKSRNKYIAKVSVSGRTVNLGRYKTEQEANEAHKIAKKDILIAAAKEQTDHRVKLALEKRARLI